MPSTIHPNPSVCTLFCFCPGRGQSPACSAHRAKLTGGEWTPDLATLLSTEGKVDSAEVLEVVLVGAIGLIAEAGELVVKLDWPDLHRFGECDVEAAADLHGERITGAGAADQNIGAVALGLQRRGVAAGVGHAV